MWRRPPALDPETAAVVRARLDALLVGPGASQPAVSPPLQVSRPGDVSKAIEPTGQPEASLPLPVGPREPDARRVPDGLRVRPRRARAAPSEPESQDWWSTAPPEARGCGAQSHGVDRSSLSAAVPPPTVPSPSSPHVPEARPVGSADAPVLGLRRLAFTRTHLVVVGIGVLAAVLVGGWAVVRARPVALASGLPPPVAASATPGASPSAVSPVSPSTSSPSPTAASRIMVDVVGAVSRPGLRELRAGARVADALRAAGGLARDADPGQLNLAQHLNDADQVVVGSRKQPGGEVRSGGSGAPGAATSANSSSAGVVNLNTATEADLDGLPGVGPVTAQKILAWRTQHGRFSSIEELQEVPGIGPKTYADLAPHVRV